MQMCCLLCRCRCRSIKASEFSMFIFRNKILRLRCFRSADKCAFAVLCVMTVAMYYVFVRLVFFFFLGRSYVILSWKVIRELCRDFTILVFSVSFCRTHVVSDIACAHVRTVIAANGYRSVAWHHQCSLSSLSKHLLLRHSPRSAICSVPISNVLDVEVSPSVKYVAVLPL